MSQTQNEEPVSAPDGPPPYVSMRSQTFVITRPYSGTQSNSVFASERALFKYRKGKDVLPKDSDFVATKISQNKHVGLPLLVSERRADVNYSHLFQALPRPDITTRAYDATFDNKLVGKISYSSFNNFNVYTILMKGKEFKVLRFPWLPITDFQLDGTKLRFVLNPTSATKPSDFVYDLYILEADQISLFEVMEAAVTENELDPQREEQLLSFLKKPPDSKDFGSQQHIGVFEHCAPTKKFCNTKECSMLTTLTAADDQNSNSEVEQRVLAFLAVALVLQKVEDVKEFDRKKKKKR